MQQPRRYARAEYEGLTPSGAYLRHSHIVALALYGVKRAYHLGYILAIQMIVNLITI